MKTNKTGVSSTIQAPTKKQKKQRKKRIAKEAKNYRKLIGKFAGKPYNCSNVNCMNTVKLPEPPTSKILCTKCNAGFFG